MTDKTKKVSLFASFFIKIFDFFLDKNGSGDEKRLFGILFAVDILVYMLGFGYNNVALITVLGASSLGLLGGAVAGDGLNPKRGGSTDAVANVFQYIRDLFLDKNGDGDEKRLLGNLFLTAGLIYPYIPGASAEVLTMTVSFGGALLGVAIVGDVFGPKEQTPPPAVPSKTESETLFFK